MPPGSGRKLCPEWLQVTKIDDQSKVICKHCGSEISSKIERIRSHLNKCHKHSASMITSKNFVDFQLNDAPTTSARSAERERQIGVEENSTVENGNDFTTVTEETVSCNKPKRQRTMHHFTISTTENQKSDLDLKIAKFFYANNIAFNVANSVEYKDMIVSLRPGYSGPSSSALAGNLLDEISTEVDNSIKKQLEENASVTLLLDGWSNVKNDPVIATCIHTGSTSFFINAVDCGSNEKTAKYCAEIAIEAIQHCNEILGIEVFAICTDNENKMVKTREILKEKYPNMISYGCSAHYLNLLEEGISNKDVLKHVVEVQRFFRNHHKPHGWLKEKCGLMPQLPNSTRWNSQIDCIDTFVKIFHKYVEISSENPDEFPRNIIKILENVMIYKEVLQIQKQITEIGKALDVMQAEKTNIAGSVELWLNVKENEILIPYKSMIETRMNQALTPVHYLAYMMSPKYMGKRLASELEDIAEEWVQTNHPEWLVPMMGFQLQDPTMFPKSMFIINIIEKFTTLQWWHLIEKRCNKTKNSDLYSFCQFMKKLANCPSSSASVERVFSTCGLVWSKLRNRLGIEKAKKLVKCHRFLKQNQYVL